LPDWWERQDSFIGTGTVLRVPPHYLLPRPTAPITARAIPPAFRRSSPRPYRRDPRLDFAGRLGQVG
jgi:hypothetical protein